MKSLALSEHPDDALASAILDASPITLRKLYGPYCLRRLCDMQAAMLVIGLAEEDEGP